jgi:serine phosphatase RsbU (regulator of sigma subunit)
MTIRRLLVALLLAATGYGSFALLFPRYDNSTTWHQELGRSDAILRGRMIVGDAAGIDVSGWQATVGTHNDDALRRYLQEMKQAPIPGYLNPLATYMIFRKPGSDDNVGLALTAAGKPSALFIHRHSVRAQGAAQPATEGAARAALGRFLSGPPIGTLSSAKRESDGMRFEWVGTPPHLSRLTLTTECLMRDGHPVEMKVTYALPPESTTTRDRLVLVRPLIAFLTQVAAIVMAIIATVRKRFPGRLLVVLMVVAFVSAFADRVVSPVLDATALDNTENFFRTKMIKDAVVAVGIAAAMGSSWAAGHAASRRRFPLSTARFDALLRGNVLSRSVASSIAVGMMSAGILAALPYWLAAVHLAGVSSVAGAASGSLFDPSYSAALVPLRLLPLMLALAFAVPIVNGIRHPAAAWALGAVLGALIIPGADRLLSVPASIVLAILIFLFYDQLLRRVDLIAVFAAATASSAVTFAATLLAQPAPSLRASGSTILLGLGITGAGFLARSLTPGNEEPEPLESWSSLDTATVGERERLLEEMSVAREAQQRMLPMAPPAIPGFSVASICRPAQGVGGDLYDFIPLEQGRWGIAVADVSGKGLPAAMYMSMTKGLLLAAADERSDALEILTDVNAGLYSVGQRNVFVTMFFAVLEPGSRGVEFVRAGHNSALWRRAVRRETVSLTPRGIALGMSGTRLFTRSCATQKLVMEDGDSLFIYSDGVTEAMNQDSEEYGDDRLATVIARTEGLDAAAARDLIIGDVSAFVGATPPSDDLTLVVVHARPLGDVADLLTVPGDAGGPPA